MLIYQEPAAWKNLSLLPPSIRSTPGMRADVRGRRFQGIPSIQCTRNGRLWSVFYAGGIDEGAENYVLVKVSDDRGEHWSEPCLIVECVQGVRAFDPNIWLDPRGRLWLFWAQSYSIMDGRFGVWAAVCDAPDEAKPVFSHPRRLCDGIMMNKPTVLRSGEWLLPVAQWEVCWKAAAEAGYNISDHRFSHVYASTDEGKTFVLRGSADIPRRSFDEHMVVERQDGTLWMLVRADDGYLGEAFSVDGGSTWTPGRQSSIANPNSRFFIGRLRSGRILLVNHYRYTGRNNLAAMLSEDDGHTWQGHLMLDERDRVSYPDACEGEDGSIYITYDRDRTGEREILMARITQTDILAGELVNADSALKMVIDRAQGAPVEPGAAMEIRKLYGLL